MLTGLFIVVRILANPLSNVFQKQLTQRSAHPLVIIGVVHAGLSAICLPWLTSVVATIAPSVWLNMLIAGVLAVSGNVLLVYALSETDLSILGPINSYKSIVSLIFAIFLLGERPTLAGLAGMLLIVSGSYFVMDKRVNQPLAQAIVRFVRGRGVQLRFAAMFLSAAEAVFLKRAIVLSSPSEVFALWAMVGFLVALAAAAVVLKDRVAEQFRTFRKTFGIYTGVVLAAGVMQLATLFTFRSLQVGYSLALFQLSAVVSVLLGGRYFAETNLRERLVGSFIMAAGAMLIVVFGHPR